MTCQQHVGSGTCPHRAAAIWTWVTGDKVAVCLDHKVAARAIAQAMGYAAIFTEIPDESGGEDDSKDRAIEMQRKALHKALAERDEARAELRDARRGEAGLREALQTLKARGYLACADFRHPLTCIAEGVTNPCAPCIAKKALAGELAGEVGT